MAQLLQHQDSHLYSKDFRGCRWSILQFFNFYHRLRSKKVLANREPGQGKNSGGEKTESSFVHLKNYSRSNRADLQIKRKRRETRKKSGKAHMRALVSIFYRQGGQKQKMFPAARRLLRTTSIHHLDCNDYVIYDNVVYNSEGSPRAVSFKDPRLEKFQKSRSFPGADFPLLGQTKFTVSEQLQKSLAGTKGEPVNPKLEKLSSDKSGSFRPACMKADENAHSNKQGQRVISSLKEEKHERRRILMDGVLHRVPYGQKMCENNVKMKLCRSASASCDRNDTSYMRNVSFHKQQERQMQHSRSLTDSLGRYSHFNDTFSVGEPEKFTRSTTVARGSFAPHYLGEMTFQSTSSNSDSLSRSVRRYPQYEVTTAIDEYSHTIMDFTNELFHENQGSEVPGNDSSIYEQIWQSEDPAIHVTQQEIEIKSIVKPGTQSTAEDTNLRTTGFNKIDISGGSVCSIQVDQKMEAHFNFVKDVFEKSCFHSEELFDAWYDLNQAALDEGDCMPYEVNIAAVNFMDMSADQLLLFDLTNEVLLDIYNKSAFHRPFVPQNAPSCRVAKPVGHHVFKVLWNELESFISSHGGSGCQLDSVPASDFATKNSWLDLHRDTETVGIELEAVLVDELLEEVVSECITLVRLQRFLQILGY